MGDFYQNGIITTLHNLADRPVEELERELEKFSGARPMGLILPSLYSELEGEALPAIEHTLDRVVSAACAEAVGAMAAVLILLAGDVVLGGTLAFLVLLSMGLSLPGREQLDEAARGLPSGG